MNTNFRQIFSAEKETAHPPFLYLLSFSLRCGGVNADPDFEPVETNSERPNRARCLTPVPQSPTISSASKRRWNPETLEDASLMTRQKLANRMKTRKELSAGQRDGLLSTLKARFEQNSNRHKGLPWAKVQARLLAHPDKLWSLQEMERTGGEPDVVGQDTKTGECIFFDCSEQTPSGRVSLCYDDEALAARKEHKPKGSAVGLATAMGVELLTEEEYFALQKLGEFDTKRSSWIKTPPEIRKRGGALYCDQRYGRVFTGYNGADSYYGGRGFRCSLRV